VKQLRGLEDPDSPSFKRYFYLLEVRYLAHFAKATPDLPTQKFDLRGDLGIFSIFSREVYKIVK
jgi:hypothetical protein